jgi:trehalose 6-phosphate synthase/phosphatase
MADSPRIREQARKIRDEMGTEILLLGVDRLDYTKGIPERLLAYEHLLRRDPSLASRTRFLQIAVPSRTRIREYRKTRREIERIVDRVNRTFRSPVRYVPRGVPPDDLVALYLAADVALVTPIRDGMNLVAKEYVACRGRGNGALVLSRFAGAADELRGAYLVDPKDIPGIARTLRRALTDDEDHRRRRMEANRIRVRAHDLHRWLGTFLDSVPPAYFSLASP